MEPSQLLPTQANQPIIFMVLNIIRTFKIFTTHEFYFISFHLLKLFYKQTLGHTDELHFIRLILSGRHAKIGDYLYKRLQPLRKQRAKILDQLLSRMSGRDRQHRPGKPNSTGDEDGKLNNVESKNSAVKSRVVRDSKTPPTTDSSSAAFCTHTTVDLTSDEMNEQKSNENSKCAAIIKRIKSKEYVPKEQKHKHCLPKKPSSTDCVEEPHRRKVSRDCTVHKRGRQLSDSDSVSSKRGRSDHTLQDSPIVYPKVSNSSSSEISTLATLVAVVSELKDRFVQLEERIKPQSTSEVIEQLGSYFDEERKRRSARIRDAYSAMTTEYTTPDELACAFYENGIIPGGPIPANAVGEKPKKSKQKGLKSKCGRIPPRTV